MDKINQYIKELNIGIKVMFKDFFNKETNKKQRANMWTFLRIVISPILFVFMLIGMPIAATITATFGALTDFFDGRSARKHGSTSEFGKILDQVADKIFATAAGITLSISNPIFLINLVGESAIAATNIIYQIQYKDIKCKSNFIGKMKQWPLFATFGLGFLSLNMPSIANITNWAIILTSLFQVAALSEYIIENEKNIKENINKKESVVIPFENNDEENEKNKIIEKDNSDLSKNKTTALKDEYIKLRNVLNQIIISENTSEITKNMDKNLENFQKQKK